MVSGEGHGIVIFPRTITQFYQTKTYLVVRTSKDNIHVVRGYERMEELNNCLHNAKIRGADKFRMQKLTNHDLNFCVCSCLINGLELDDKPEIQIMTANELDGYMAIQKVMES